jgi:hypothetical protein
MVSNTYSASQANHRRRYCRQHWADCDHGLVVVCDFYLGSGRMMEYVLVALMLISPGVYNFEVMAEYQTMMECEKSLSRANKNGTTKIVSLICAKKDRV